MLSATASLGMSMLWDTELGISQVDKYSYSSEEHIKVSSIARPILATQLTFRSLRTILGRGPPCYGDLAQWDQDRARRGLCFARGTCGQQVHRAEGGCHQRVC